MLRKTFNFRLSLNAHIIDDHLIGYFRSTCQGFGVTSDQLIESMHQHIDNVFRKNGYLVKAINSELQGTNLLQGLLHLSTYNM